MNLKPNKYLILLFIIIISGIFLLSTNFNKITGFVTKTLQSEPQTIMKVLSDENGNTVKTLKNEIFIAIIADKNNCIDNNFIIYQNNNEIKREKLADNKICEKKTIKYNSKLPYGSYTLAAIDINTKKELRSDFEL